MVTTDSSLLHVLRDEISEHEYFERLLQPGGETSIGVVLEEDAFSLA